MQQINDDHAIQPALMYDGKQVARLFNVSDPTIRRLEARGLFPAHIQLGGERSKRLWLGSDLIAYRAQAERRRAGTRVAQSPTK